MQRSDEISAIVTSRFEAAAKGDVSWRDRHVSKLADLRIVGTDPAEWLSGGPAYEFLRNEAANIGGKMSVVVHDAEGFVEGSVGWGVARPELTLPDGGKVSPRWSAVFHREDGAWKLVQLHASIGMGNEAAFGEVFG